MRYYLCGPFWDKECSEFFDKFIERCKETGLANYNTKHSVSSSSLSSVPVPTEWDEKGDVESKIISMDGVFVPGHFKIDFNKVKSEYDPVSFRRVLRQILDLDLSHLDDGGIVVYPKGYDLGSMFELGYYLAGNMEFSRFMNYNSLRKKLIIKDPDEKLIECIDAFMDAKSIPYDGILNKFCSNDSEDKSENSLEFESALEFLISNGNPSDLLNNDRKFKSIAINVDCYKETPFNSILAGYLYRLGIPFFTFSTENAHSNVMMIASSMFHVNVSGNNVNEELTESLNNLNKLYWDDSCFDRFKDIK